MTSDRILRALAKRLETAGNVISIRNIYLYDWESDMIAVSHIDEIVEYEIKVSRQDFFADFNKADKHKILKTGKVNSPNRFWYVVPEGLITPDEVPDYAGLYYMNEKNFFPRKKPAPVIHDYKINREMWKELAIRIFNKKY